MGVDCLYCLAPLAWRDSMIVVYYGKYRFTACRDLAACEARIAARERPRVPAGK